jgi:HAMP domain-containing protein
MSMTPVRWHHSLAWKFFLRTALAILFLMGVVLWVAFDQAQKGARNAAERGLRTAGRVLDKHIPQEARVLDAGLEVFVTQSTNSTYIDSAEKRGDSGSVRDYLLQSLANLKSDIAVVVRPTGQLLSCTTDGRRRDYTEAAIAQMALDPEGARGAGFPGPSYAGFLELPEGTHRGFYLAVSRPLRLPDGHLIGAMLVGRRLDDAAAAELRDMAVGRVDPPSHVAVLSMGRIVGSTLEGQASGLGQALSAGDRYGQIRARLLEGQPSGLIPLRLDRTDYLARVNPLRGSDGPRYELATALLLPLEPFMAPFRRLQWTILGTGAAGLLVALGVALRSARGVTAPLARLTAATAQLAEGGRPDLPADASADEVGTLTTAFRVLLGELKAKDDLLAALGGLQAGASAEPRSQVGMTMVDLDATVMMPSASQVVTGARPEPVARRITLKEGEIFAGRYRIESVLGKGGMGLVLKARDQQLDEDVAIKVIRPDHVMDASFLEQLKQEIKLARRITHRHVLRTHDFGDAAGIPFVTMEYLKGVTLKQLLDDRGRLPLPLVLRIGRQVSEGLEAAHAVGVVHRDIKPMNVLFDARGDAKLMDFGLAAPVAAAGANAEGQIFGTPRYMAPEQARGAKADPRTDLYSLGVMLFELSVGRPPFEGSDITELLRQHMQSPPPDAATLAPELPLSFTRLLARLLAKDMDARPSSAAEVVELLKLVASGDADTVRR